MPSTNYHSYYLDVLKKFFGASFIAWQEENGKKSLKVKISSETRYFPFEGNITEDTYLKLIQDLRNEQTSEKTI
jgi:hypothetical protein